MFNLDKKPDILNLLEKVQAISDSSVDEERGDFQIDESVRYNMLGGTLSNQDLLHSLGSREHTVRTKHDGQIAKIVEKIGDTVARFSIVFEDGFTLSDIATSEILAITESADVYVGADVVLLHGGYKGEKGKVVDFTLEGEVPDFDAEGGQVDVRLASGKMVYVPVFSVKVLESKVDEAEDATQTMKPQEKPDLNAEDVGMEDYSDEELNTPEAKVKSKSEETGNAIRGVEDDELEQTEDKVVEPKNESKIKEDQRIVDRFIDKGLSRLPHVNDDVSKVMDELMSAEGEKLSPEEWQDVEKELQAVVDSYLDESKIKEALKKQSRGDAIFQSTSSKVKDDADHFPINNANQARNALARANQYSSAPKWYKGSLDALVKRVANAVKAKYPSIKVTKASRKPGKNGTNEATTMADMYLVTWQNTAAPVSQERYVDVAAITPKQAEFKAKGVLKRSGIDADVIKIISVELKEATQKEFDTFKRNNPATEEDERQEEAIISAYLLKREAGWSREDAVQFVAKGSISPQHVRKLLSIRGVTEKDHSFLKTRLPLWLCEACGKTFRAEKSVCSFCESATVEKLVKEARDSDLVGHVKKAWKVTWKDKETGKEDSTRVMGFDKASAEKEASRPNRKIIKSVLVSKNESKESDDEDESDAVQVKEFMGQEGLPKVGKTYRISTKVGHSWETKNYKVTGVDYQRTGRGDLGKYFQVEGDTEWYLASLYHFDEVGVEEAKKKEVKPFRTIEVVRSQVDPDVFNIRVVELPKGDMVILDTKPEKEAALKKGRELANILNAKFLGIIGEATLEEAEEETFITVGKGLEKEDADKLAQDKEGQVIQDEDDDTKFAVITKGV